jgi:RNA methyltransferase, TrmH family
MARGFPVSPSRAPARRATTASDPAPSRLDTIRSRDNQWLKQFRALLRGGGPERGQPIGVEGPKLVEEGLRAGLETEALLVSETGERELERILGAASQTERGIPRSRVLRTTDELFRSVAGTQTPQGVAALFRPREWSFEDVLRGVASSDGAFRGAPPLVVVLAGVQDPGNVGTILRSAEAFGGTGAIAVRGTADPWSPKAVRASAGSALRLPLLRGLSAPVVMAQLRVAGVKIYAATSQLGPRGEGERRQPSAHAATDFREPVAIFIGSEGRGLASEIRNTADDLISVPISDAVESLNAAIAASVLLYEAARQRRGEESN